jgi:Zn-dependent M28 family amino/carboxypeptidase
VLDPEQLRAIDRAIVGDVLTADHAWDNLKELVDRFGSRFGGSEGERGGRDFLAGRLREYGLDSVSVEELEYTGWVRGSARLDVIAPRPMSIPCIALPYCPTGDVTGDLVFLGDGAPQDYADKAERLRGSVAMVTTRPPRFLGRGMHRGEKFGRAVAAGCAAFIWMRHEGGLLPETGSLRFDKAAEVPGIGISYEAGAALNRLAESGPVRLRVRTESVIRRMPSWNVVGEIRGRWRPDEVVVFGAHFDGHDISEGARDDGAGACVIVEAARALAQHREHVGRTVRFVTFALEELGLIGAFGYVRAHAAEMGRHVFMMNMDGAGGVGETSCVLQGWPELVSPLKGMFRDMRESVIVGDQISLYSDMYPFAVAGVPAGTMGSRDLRPGQLGRGWGHTAADTLDKINPKGLRMDAALAARLALRLSQVEPFPAAHKTPAEMRALLERERLVEILEYEGRPVPGA